MTLSFSSIAQMLTVLSLAACNNSPNLQPDSEDSRSTNNNSDSMGGEPEGASFDPQVNTKSSDENSELTLICGAERCTLGFRCEESECVENSCADLECSEGKSCSSHSEGGSFCRDLSCSADVGCNESEYCGAAGKCAEDVCTQASASCSGSELLVCSPTGAEEQSFACSSESYFSATCDAEVSVAACSCEDDWDCPANMVCEVGACAGTGAAPTCTLEPVAFSETPPALEIQWGGVSPSNADAIDGQGAAAPWPQYSNVVGTPVVANLTDDNGDGKINELDFPEIIFVSYETSSDWRSDGVVRALHGGGPDKGKDYFARCGETLWSEGDAAPAGCANGANGAADGRSAAGAAVADLNNDGLPEIIYIRENLSIRVLNHKGETLLTTEANTWNEPSGSSPGTISVANLDYAGFAEVVIGSNVLLFDNDAEGNLELTHILEGNDAAGSNGFGLFSCIADLSPDPGQEIVAGSTLYRLPDALPTCDSYPCSGELTTVWDAETVAANVDNNKVPTKLNGFCAVANIWGDDFSSPPGPDNDPSESEKAEVILIADGYLNILAGATGELIHERNLEGGDLGGAPNIDDFDGDGFMEVASALQNFYVVVDLQPATNSADFNSLGSCPAWPDTLTRAVGDNSDPSSFNPNLRISGNQENVAKPRLTGAACSEASDCAEGMTCGAAGECICLHNGWQRGSDDDSSKSTSSSVFDFNGDGIAEVIYNDECEMRVYDGVSGAVYYNENSRSRTGIENPIVADVDNDGNAEIVTVLNTDSNNRCDDDAGGITTGPNGVRVWGDPSDTWVSARRIWNQMSYSVTNINESGSVPQHAAESWRSFNGRVYNTYRSQPRNSGVAPDLTMSGVSITSPDATCGTLSEKLEIGFQAENLGDLRVGPGVLITFYGVWGDDEEALKAGSGETLTYTLSQSLEPKAVLIESVEFDLADQSDRTELPTSIRVEIDSESDAMTGYGAERECNESNNSTIALVEPGESSPDLVVSTDTTEYNCSTSLLRVGLTIENQGSSPAESFDVSLYAGDPAQGGTFLQQESFSEILEPGASINPVVKVTTTQADNAKIWAVVNPQQSLVECNYANNIDPADGFTERCILIIR